MTDAVDPWLSDVKATARRVAAEHGVSSDPSVYGDLCLNDCGRYALSADRASCAHRPICEDCWPNGCPECEAKIEADLRRRREFVGVIVSSAEQIYAAVLDVPTSDLLALDWRERKDLIRAATSGSDALLRIRDTLLSQAAGHD